ncbi:hypothetical protein BDM02DRAFT_3131284 [Thelephora ganbajun]|uniref:Uncharacterized protein n=1 Tax=Thelephora ganbajun TaxID=370292 RepID=A0ACB6Z5Y0_THEGA|nr:hypothetical protein BDM02DRAFT_3131284 [Thelephora ganbajun]
MGVRPMMRPRVTGTIDDGSIQSYKATPDAWGRYSRSCTELISGEFETKPSDTAKIPRTTSGTFPDLVFSDYIYEDGELKAVKEADEAEAWQNRGNTALVYARLLERRIFPVESFGGKDDFDASKTRVVYTALEPDPPTPGCLRHDTPSRTNDGTKVAWAKLSEDGYESDCVVLVVYSLKDESYKLTPCWNRSPAFIFFSEDDKYIYFTTGTEAHVKVFVLQVPASKLNSNKGLASPFKPTDEHTTSAIQHLFSGRLLYLQNSFMKPNDVHITRGLEQLPASYDFDVVLRAFGEMDGRPGGIRTEGRLSISERDGNISSITISGCGPWRLELFWVLTSPPQVDRDRAVAGASYGGYTIKYFFAPILRDRDKDVPGWIQSKPGFRFGLKALVCHDGIFDSQYGEYSTGEHYFFNRGFGGQSWKDKTRDQEVQPVESRPQVVYSQVDRPGGQGSSSPQGCWYCCLPHFATPPQQRQGVPSRLAIFPDENHWVLNHGNNPKWHYEICRWLNQTLNNRCTQNSERMFSSQTKDLDDEVADPLSKLRDFFLRVSSMPSTGTFTQLNTQIWTARAQREDTVSLRIVEEKWFIAFFYWQ